MKKVKSIPAKQRVVVLPDDNPEMIGRIYVPSSAEKDGPRTGVIVAAGKGEKDIPMEYNVGQKVMFSKYSGMEVELHLVGTEKPTTYLVMNQMDIMMALEEVQQ